MRWQTSYCDVVLESELNGFQRDMRTMAVENQNNGTALSFGHWHENVLEPIYELLFFDPALNDYFKKNTLQN